MEIGTANVQAKVYRPARGPEAPVIGVDGGGPLEGPVQFTPKPKGTEHGAQRHYYCLVAHVLSLRTVNVNYLYPAMEKKFVFLHFVFNPIPEISPFYFLPPTQIYHQ